MDDEDGYFPERVAATYDDSSEGMFDPALADTVADVLASLAAGGRALELGGLRRLGLETGQRRGQVRRFALGANPVQRGDDGPCALFSEDLYGVQGGEPRHDLRVGARPL